MLFINKLLSLTDSSSLYYVGYHLYIINASFFKNYENGDCKDLSSAHPAFNPILYTLEKDIFKMSFYIESPVYRIQRWIDLFSDSEKTVRE